MNTTLRKMNRTPRNFAQAGFTLVELLIVVVILAILAAIVIPQFSSSTTDAKEAALDSNLGTLRASIELYHAQHGAYPGANVATGATCTGSVAGTGAVTTGDALISQLTMFSNAIGGTCTAYDAVNSRFGPYLRKSFPNDPNGLGSLSANIVVTALGTPIVATAVGGWAYDAKSGQIIMNNTALDSKNLAYSLH